MNLQLTNYQHYGKKGNQTRGYKTLQSLYTIFPLPNLSVKNTNKTRLFTNVCIITILYLLYTKPMYWKINTYKSPKISVRIHRLMQAETVCLYMLQLCTNTYQNLFTNHTHYALLLIKK